jgi:hypothetical protein
LIVYDEVVVVVDDDELIIDVEDYYMYFVQLVYVQAMIMDQQGVLVRDEVM